ncbi:MAG: aminotransferase class I/II-fold pyridoxal phosphate-dependent enzyme [Clostridiales bacterium]|jgi:DNA-binding transcriptional MocR family regulator|nr:aminotransferase class I/II-fold pyridoxal phosphate-dependent enzyme [Clostridiales bacterium]
MNENYLELSPAERAGLLAAEQKKYRDFKAKNLKLDMSRGKPCREQLDLSLPMLTDATFAAYTTDGGADARNYGTLEGIIEIRRLYADVLGVAAEQIIAGGSSSLNMMYDAVQRGMQFGFGGCAPWNKSDKIKFLCPVPGYDRHFAVTELFGIEMIAVELKSDGPDADEIERLCAADDSIKGIWCVPRFSNPTGAVYSEETSKRLASMKAAPDFRIFWDNAYAVHTLTDDAPDAPDIIAECKRAGNPDRAFVFTSTSKVTFAGAGVAFFASSESNIKEAKSVMGMQTIGPDKINQLRHALFLKDKANISEHMKKHRAILKPKFDAVIDALERGLSKTKIAKWTTPAGGYFVSVDVFDGTAKRVVGLAKECGVVLTSAGATYPYGKDPSDKNIRFAPTMPPLAELKTAAEVFVCCVKIAALEKLTD